MSIGDKWQQFGMGSMNKESSFKLLDAYFDLGVRLTLIPYITYTPLSLIEQGNFIDTANF
jgi:hypothetical protein